MDCAGYAYRDVPSRGPHRPPAAYKLENCKAGIRAKVEPLLRVLKRQFGFVKVRYW